MRPFQAPGLAALLLLLLFLLELLLLLLFLLELLLLLLAEQLLKRCSDGRALACECAPECPLRVWSTLTRLRTEAQLCAGARALTWVIVGQLAWATVPEL